MGQVKSTCYASGLHADRRQVVVRSGQCLALWGVEEWVCNTCAESRAPQGLPPQSRLPLRGSTSPTGEDEPRAAAHSKWQGRSTLNRRVCSIGHQASGWLADWLYTRLNRTIR